MAVIALNAAMCAGGRMVEGIFGAEETRSHRLLCRYRKKEPQERFGVLLAITWNVRALNRIRCAAEPAVMPAAAQGRDGPETSLRIRPPRLPPNRQNDGIRHFGRFAGEL